MASLDDLRVRAGKAADEILADDRGIEEQGDGTFSARTLSVLASHDLLRSGFLDPGYTGPQAGDMERVCAIMSALAEQSGAVATVYMVNGVLAPLCVSCLGTPAQKQSLLPGVAQGRVQLAFALTEPEAGSDAGAARTEAIPAGDGYRLRGEKTYITGSATADYILTVARTAPDRAKAFGIFLVPGKAPNLTVTALPKLSANGCASCHVVLEAVAVPADAVLGGSDALEAAWNVLRLTGALERLVVAAMASGLARAATRRAAAFIKERKQFGQVLSSFQSIQHTVVEMSTLTTAMELMVANAIRAYESGDDATEAISKAKYFCSEQLQKVVGSAVRVMGGRAYFDFEPVSRYYREATFSLFAGGTIEVQKMLIARSIGI
ncbi:MAG: acyl-CoA dehydrogenase [Burkholderia sp.]|jgi:alkylation response protein AidB-like acyl-CoA dehydrogenase|uniref:acyl-CoA dehydrogenase family protein n=1 Tax=Burkholderia sp. TaxID=36773 RepID=UPI002820B342|nr:acyl-CoA dehydrogenase [Burkholderia sp.]MDR0244231.1 acyl-CoA dehydrogenase [Burkholderia sp.]